MQSVHCRTLSLPALPAEGLGPILLAAANSTNLKSVLPLRNGVGWQDDGTPACNWTGITCDPLTSHIISINLSSTSITGPLSPLWADIPGLQSLDLSGNKLTGTVPAEWASNFTNVVNLNLSSNLLSGALPTGESCLWHADKALLIAASGQ